MFNVLFRADANPSIGIGHVMRCLSLADAIASNGGDARFILGDKAACDYVKQRGYEAFVLDSDYRDMEDELGKWPEKFADYLIVDSYYVTRVYLNTLHEAMRECGGRLVYFDDVYSFPYDVDILINYNAYAKYNAYERLYKGTNYKIPRLLLGPTYTPLRSVFCGLERKNQSEKVQNIMISTGGSDELHLSIAIMHYLCKEDVSVNYDYNYHFLIGSMNEDKDELRKTASACKNIVVHENVTDMRNLIVGMDLAISAAGSTLYEISACGVPVITFSLADNQIAGGEAFENLGLGVYVGDLREPCTIKHDQVMSEKLGKDAAKVLMEAINGLSYDYNKRVIFGEKMQELIDGNGAERVVQRLIDWRID